MLKQSHIWLLYNTYRYFMVCTCKKNLRNEKGWLLRIIQTLFFSYNFNYAKGLAVLGVAPSITSNTKQGCTSPSCIQQGTPYTIQQLFTPGQEQADSTKGIKYGLTLNKHDGHLMNVTKYPVTWSCKSCSIADQRGNIGCDDFPT